MWYWLFKYIFMGPLLSLLGRPKVEGLEHVPQSGPVILASNHLAVADSFYLPLVVSRRITFLAKAEYFTGTGLKGWFTRWFYTVAGQVPIDRTDADSAQSALTTAERILGEGKLLGMYPEGTRSPDGRLFKGKTGLARVALTSGVPVIPVAMIVLVGALHLLLRHTWVGMSLRAMAQQPTVARMCGIRVSRVAIVTFMTGAVFAGVAGFLMSSVFMVHPLIGNMIVLKAFTVVILGGMGSVTGAAAAGLMLGLVESMTSAYLGNGLRDIVGFLMVVIVLLAWPQGIFGRNLERS